MNRINEPNELNKQKNRSNSRYNNKIIAIVAFVVLFAFLRFISAAYSDMKYLNTQEVKTLVFFHSDTDENDVTDFTMEKSVDEKGLLIYTVSYADSKGVYQFVLEAEKGNILKYSKLNKGNPIPDIFDISEESSDEVSDGIIE